MAVANRGVFASTRTLLKKGRDKLASMQDAALVFALHQFRSKKPHFDQGRAFEHLVKQCGFGPRIVGTTGHRQCRRYIVEKLEACTTLVQQQPFQFKDRELLSMIHRGTNIIASFNPIVRSRRILLCTHWDTRPLADQDPEPELRTEPVPGANDGASGVAVLLELAQIMADHPPAIGVDLAFFDLEDMGDYDFEHNLDTNPFCIGSTYFADHLLIQKPRFGILLDMVGGKSPRFYREGYSEKYAKPIVDYVWGIAQASNAPAFQDKIGDYVFDDHIPFLKKGIPVINIGDFEYASWHTTRDTPDKCSAESLAQVGNVLLELLYHPPRNF